jgi:hypothetical protein
MIRYIIMVNYVKDYKNVNMLMNEKKKGKIEAEKEKK